QALQVATVLGGSVRRAANRLRVTAQLTDARNGYNLWSETYDREMGDVFAVEDEISHAVMRALEVHLVSGDSLKLLRRPTRDVEAYELYLKGRYFYNKGGFGPVQQALAYFQQALAHDSNYALAYGGIADAYQRLTASTYLRPREGMPKARAAVLKALALDPTLADAHASLGDQLCVYDWDASAAERELRRAIELNPSVANAHYFYANCLAALERRPPGKPAVAIALVQLGLGNNDQALRWLQVAYEERAEWLVMVTPAPFLDPLRPDPRFSALMRKVGIE